MRQYVTFSLHRQHFGIEILLVREINQITECTPVQHAPPYIYGLVNLRGQIITIFDLGTRLGLTACESERQIHNVVLKSDDELTPIRTREDRDDLVSSSDMVGLRVDSIGEVVELDEEKIEQVPANVGKLNKRFLSGVFTQKDNILLILDTKELLRNESNGAGPA
jgi:purine-binding chemotaxis protein CheW